jgi:hypothetical protein
MQKKSINQSLLAAGILLLGFNQTVAAHTLQGALGTTATATDYYQVDCTSTNAQITHHLFANIQDRIGDGTLVGVSVFSANAGANAKAATTIDTLGGVATLTAAANSPNITVAGGGGIYTLAVFKTGAAGQVYTLNAHCEDVNGVEIVGIPGLSAPGALINNQ